MTRDEKLEAIIYYLIDNANDEILNSLIQLLQLDII